MPKCPDISSLATGKRVRRLWAVATFLCDGAGKGEWVAVGADGHRQIHTAGSRRRGTQRTNQAECVLAR